MAVDPVWGAPEASYQPDTGIETHGSSKLGKDEFLTLLVAQLKNQDPLKPSNPEEMAAQLAQFSSLEQLIEVNERLDSQATSNAAMAAALNNSSAVGVIGKDVLASGDHVQLTGSGDESITVGVGAGGGNATLRLYSANGTEVGSYSVGPVGGGRQVIELGDIGQDVPPGTYRYELSVTGTNEEPVDVQTFARAHIDGVRYGPSGPVLVSGDLEIPLANVVEIIAE